MLWLMLYVFISVFIARWLEPRMKVASIFHSVMFIIIGVFLLFVADAPWLGSIVSEVVGEDAYDIFRTAILIKYGSYSSQISAFVVVETVILCLTLLVAVTSAFKLAQVIIKLYKKKTGFHKRELNPPKFVPHGQPVVNRIYIHYCRLLN